MIRPVRTILLIFGKMGILVRPRIFLYSNHRTRTDLNVLLFRILTSPRIPGPWILGRPLVRGLSWDNR